MMNQMWQYNSNELMHYGVLGMKWGKRKSSYESDTTYRRTALTKDGKVAYTEGAKALNKKEDRKAQRAASKAGAAYDKQHGRTLSKKGTGNEKDRLSAMGNAYAKSINDQRKKYQKDVENVKKSQDLYKEVTKQGAQLFKAGGQKAKRDFGSYSQIDDIDYLADVAKHEWKINTDKFDKANQNYHDFYSQNKESIKNGKKYIKKYNL